MKIIIYKQAQNNLKSIYNYIEADSTEYARKTVDNIFLYINKLEYFPYIGRYIPEFNNKYYRELLYKSYRIIYKVIENMNEVHVIAVIHGKRNFKSFYNFYDT